ncbi:MAG: primosomal protein N' [Microbacteriaceae bacterium]|nr:primosomal protein N' [Microbacteriaceae bacterium]HPZ35287.1 primosomal protein N' [Microbacteriaceae bacterium]HQC92597.1 primosomal protein N' [Microbacteriaceae bacterium]
MTSRRIARVLLDSPLPQLDRLFDYAVPAPLMEAAAEGVRVRVPLRSAGRIADGFIVELADVADIERPLSDLDAVVSAVPVLPAPLARLARRVADRAAGSAIDILRLVIPKRQVRVEKAWLARIAEAATADTPASGTPASDTSASDTSASDTSASDTPASAAPAPVALSAFPGLAEALDARRRLALQAPPHQVRLASGETVGAWAELLAAAALRAFEQGRSAIVVVPDYRDLAQLDAALRRRIPEEALVRSDARRSNPERYRGFLRSLEARPCVVIGNRSAVYAPVHALGLLAVWDDGNPLLGEPLAPYVHTRDAALVRNELEPCALLFAGITRSSDVQRLVEVGWVTEIAPARRSSPRVVLSAPAQGETPGARIPSAAYRDLRAGLEHGPVLVQVARPGYSPVLVCAACRSPARCLHCAGPLEAPAPRAPAICRWCARTALDWRCTHCEGDKLRLASSGSRRTADDLGRAFPEVRVIVSDGERPLTHVSAEPALVIATRGAEPIADGGYRGVLLLDGERMLMAESLRIGESCLRWWSGAAALAAAGAPVHLVGVVGPVARALATWTQPAYARAELVERAPLLMPPTVRVAVVEGDTPVVEAALRDLAAAVPGLPPLAVLGPVPQEEAGMGRALVRFEYAQGAEVAASLRASVVAAAIRSRRPARPVARRSIDPATPPRRQRNTLKVRLDDPELQL